MILRPVAIGSNAATVHSTRAAPGGLAEENELKWPQKGDFNEQMSFAKASKERYYGNTSRKTSTPV